MHIELIELRQGGRKVARDKLAPAQQGVLIIERWTLAGDPPRKVISARFRSGYLPGGPDLLPPLNDAQVITLDERGLVIVGMQSTGEPGHTTPHRQAWACRLVATDRPSGLPL